MNRIYYMYAWIFGRPALMKFNKMIYNLSLRALGIYNYQNIFISGEIWFIKNVVRNLGEDLIILDVGANVGSYSKSIFHHGISASEIYAFEPNPVTYEKLKKSVLGMPVQPIQLALSDSNGIANLFDRPDSIGSHHASLSKDIFPEIYHVDPNSSPVELKTLDNFCRLNEITTIDLLKIDVEGYEINVLRGAVKMIEDRRIRAIQFEFTQLNSVLGIFFKDIYDLLSDRYHIYRLLPHGIEHIKRYDPTICEIFGYQNFGAVLKD